jgi:2-oxoisovalerate dehydrogenase E1 component subunit alpha
VQVDGNDYIAIKETLDQMLLNARQGKGACVIEALTYRLSDHTTADDASRYRDARDVEHYKERDPLRRMQQYLQTQMGWTDAKQSALKIQCQQQIEAAVKEYLATEPVPPTDMFDYLYEILPKALQSQRAEVEQIWQAQLDAQSTPAHIEEGENV